MSLSVRPHDHYVLALVVDQRPWRVDEPCPIRACRGSDSSIPTNTFFGAARVHDTDQRCAIDSTQQSALAEVPRGEPSSNHLWRYHAPSQALCAMAACRRLDPASQRGAKVVSPRYRTRANCVNTVHRKKPSQTTNPDSRHPRALERATSLSTTRVDLVTPPGAASAGGGEHLALCHWTPGASVRCRTQGRRSRPDFRCRDVRSRTDVCAHRGIPCAMTPEVKATMSGPDLG